jgi:hypothetical protein
VGDLTGNVSASGNVTTNSFLRGNGGLILGVYDPYPISSGWLNMQVGSALLQGGKTAVSAGPSLAYNSYWNGNNWIRSEATGTAIMSFDSGGFNFLTNTSGTANIAFTPTSCMTITPAGTVSATTFSGSNIAMTGCVSAYAFTAATGQPVLIAPNQSEKVRIDVNGNVGIGNTAAVHTLSVNGTAYVGGQLLASNHSVTGTTTYLNAAGLSVLATNPDGTQYGMVGMLQRTNAGNIGLTFSQSGVSSYGILHPNGGGLTFVDNRWPSNLGGGGTGGSGTERMRIAPSTGYVGIANASPAHNLSVEGTSYLNGAVTATGSVTAAAGNLNASQLSVSGNATVSGALIRGVPVTKTANFTLAATESYVICNGAGSIAVTLPAASAAAGRDVTIKTIAAQTVTSAASDVYPLAGGGLGTSILLGTAGKYARLVSNSSGWVIMEAN